MLYLTRLSCVCNFNPRSPRGGATYILKFVIDYSTFQSTLPTRGSDCIASLKCTAKAIISIHAPHEGERPVCNCVVAYFLDFNPRSPRGGATIYCVTSLIIYWISIHAPHEGERHIGDAYVWGAQGISIHAPHEGERLHP